MTARYRYRLPWGADCRADGTTDFRLWASAQPKVWVEIEGTAPVAMQSQSGGWHAVRLACTAGVSYRYVLADGTRVPDPAARAQLGGPHGYSLVVDPTAYEWRHATHWLGRPWHETVLYELHVGALGGYRGVQAQLPRLARLGITAIELMPLAEFSGQRNWGYDGVLPYAPASPYGTADELKALIDAAHAVGLMVFLDVVYNHFGPDGNYLPVYAPLFFDSERTTPWGPAINFAQPEVREFFIHNALYWLFEYRFDGLRLDAAHAIGDPTWLEALAMRVKQEVETREPGRHIHLVLENEDNRASLLARGFAAQWNDDAHNALHVLLTGEHEGYYRDFAGRPTYQLARCLAEGFAYQGERATHLGRARGESSTFLPPTAFVLFLQNHDQVGNRAFGERLCTLCDPQALRAAVALMLLCPQIPLLFMGEEWGCEQPFFYFTDYRDALACAVREGRRAEFSHFSQFSDPVSRAAIPDPNDPQTFLRSCPNAEHADGTAIATCRAWYRVLLSMRHRHLIPRLMGARSLYASVCGQGAVRARWRMGDGAILCICVNLHAESVACPDAPSGMLLCDTPPGAAQRLAAGELPGYGCVAWLEVRQ